MRALAVAVMFATLVACAGEADVTGDRRINGSVTAVFTVRPARVEVGKSVRLTMRLTNNSGRNVDLRFNTGQSYDFSVTRGGREVWRWSKGRSFTQGIVKKTIEPFGTLVFAESWISEGAGAYVAHGVVRANSYEHVMDGKLTVR